MEFEEGDDVEFDWGSETLSGVFIGRECRGPKMRLCAIIESDRGTLPVHIEHVRAVL